MWTPRGMGGGRPESLRLRVVWVIAPSPYAFGGRGQIKFQVKIFLIWCVRGGNMLTVSSLSLPQTYRHNQPRRSWYESRKWGEGVVQSAVKLS